MKGQGQERSAFGAILLALASLGQISVTNHAGRVVTGEFGGVTNDTFVVSGRRYPLSALPKSEQQRVKAQAGLDVRTAKEKRIDADLAYELRRIDVRLEEGAITAEEAEKLRAIQRASAAHRRRRPSAPAR